MSLAWEALAPAGSHGPEGLGLPSVKDPPGLLPGVAGLWRAERRVFAGDVLAAQPPSPGPHVTEAQLIRGSLRSSCFVALVQGSLPKPRSPRSPGVCRGPRPTVGAGLPGCAELLVALDPELPLSRVGVAPPRSGAEGGPGSQLGWSRSCSVPSAQPYDRRETRRGCCRPLASRARLLSLGSPAAARSRRQQGFWKCPLSPPLLLVTCSGLPVRSHFLWRQGRPRTSPAGRGACDGALQPLNACDFLALLPSLVPQLPPSAYGRSQARDRV